jgi:hypothetical protein
MRETQLASVDTYIHIISFRRSTNSVVQTVGYETCQINNTQTEHTKKHHKTKRIKYTDVSTTVSKYMYREQQDNRIIQYKAQQKQFTKLIISAELQKFFYRVK